MHHPQAPGRWRRLRHGAIVIGLTLSALVGGLTLTQEAAAADPANVPGCGTFDFNPSIFWVYASAGGKDSQLGCPTGNTGVTPGGVGVFQHFRRGSIYWKSSVGGTQPQIVLDPIRNKWRDLGWEQGLMGWPTASTFPVRGPDDELGAFTEFEGGTILTSSAGTFEVHGAIREKMLQLGVATVGFPTSDETDFPEGGKASHFTRAGLYWWPDTGVLHLKNDRVTVNYSGLLAIEEMDWDQGSSSDEPYVTVGAVAPSGGRTIQSSVYSDVDSGEGRSEVIRVYRGRPEGIDLASVVMENDFGDPDDTREGVTLAVGLGMSALEAAIGLGSPAVAAIVAPFLVAVAPDIAHWVDGALGLGDDVVGHDTRVVGAREMITRALGTNLSWKGVNYSFYEGPFTGGGSRYGVGFTFVAG